MAHKHVAKKRRKRLILRMLKKIAFASPIFIIHFLLLSKDYIGISSAIESSLGNKGCRAINNKIHGILEDHYRVFPPLCIEQQPNEMAKTIPQSIISFAFKLWIHNV